MDNENRKFTVVSFFVLASLVGLVTNLVCQRIFFTLKLPGILGYPPRVWSLSIAVLVGVALFVALSANRRATGYTDEVFAELRKTTWPAGRETTLSTVVVSVLVGIAALMFFLMDTVWGLLFKALL